jgi:hypothetical protein
MKKFCTFKVPALGSFVLSVYLLGFGGGSKIRVSSFRHALLSSFFLPSPRASSALVAAIVKDFEVTFSCKKYGTRFLSTLWKKSL